MHCWGYMKFYFIAALIALMPLSVQAKDWERLPDGRVVIEFYDVKLAFRENDNVGVYMSYVGGIIKENKHQLTISDIINSPDETRDALKAMKQLPNWRIRLMFSDIPVEVGGKKRLLPGYTADMDIRTAREKDYRSLECRSQSVDPKDSIFSAKVGGGFSVDSSHSRPLPRVETYCLDVSKRKYRKKSSLKITCDKINIIDCENFFRTASRAVTVNYRFRPEFAYFMKDSSRASKQVRNRFYLFPMSEWEELDHRLYQYFQSYLVNEELLP